MRLELIDKTTDQYNIYSREFRKLYDSRYFIGKEKPNPFRYLDNRFYYGYDKDEFVGAINILFIKEDIYKQFLSGELSDDMLITKEDIVPFDPDKPQFIYLCSIYVTKEHQNHGYGEQILKQSLKDVLKDCKSDCHVFACCINDISKKLIEKQDFKHHLTNELGDYVMTRDFIK